MTALFRAGLALIWSGVFALGAAMVEAAAPNYRHRISPKVALWLASPALRARAGFSTDPQVQAPVVIRFTRTPSVRDRRSLEAEGVSFLTSGDQPRHHGLIYPARASPRGVRALAESALVARAELDVLLFPAPPLALTMAEIQASDLWPRLIEGQTLTGRGVTIGSIDSGVDPFHAAFFRADGGLFPWIDGNQNGVLDPGPDGVDLNGDGVLGDDEHLGFVEAYAFAYNIPILDSDNGRYDPGIDWLYVDSNRNNRRDQGASDGYGDETPTFGERLFTAEDLDHDGRLTPNEQLRALGTSKIRAIYEDGVIRRRDVDLSEADTRTAFHGTGTSGIMVSGQPGLGQRVGAAPDAELLMVRLAQTDAIAAGMTWLESEGADLILHEYAPWTGFHLDGSSIQEALMDQLSAAGLPQINPAGNLGGTAKQLSLALEPSETATTTLFMTPGLGEYTLLSLTLLWRQPEVDLEADLIDPDGRRHRLRANNPRGEAWGDGQSTLSSYRDDSDRGTAMLDSVVIGHTLGGPRPIPQGSWRLVVRNPGPAPVALRAYLSDDLSTWSRGIGFLDHAAEDGIVCFPATADSAIAVAAYAGHSGPPFDRPGQQEAAGELRPYSGRGSRIDGRAPVIDLAAPDNPLSPTLTSWGGLGGYYVFGGTSGAGPHVAGAVALLKQALPSLDGAAIETLLQRSAAGDLQTGPLPSLTWGHGKLRAYRALFDADPVPGNAPVVHLELPAKLEAGAPFLLTVQISDPEDSSSGLELRLDEGYQDAYGPYGPLADPTLLYPEPGWQRLKVEVRDPSGRVGAAALRFEVKPATPAPPTPDAGLSADAEIDAGSPDRPDAGFEAGPPPTAEAGGCSCSDTYRTEQNLSALLGWLFFLALVVRRRRAQAAPNRR